MFNDLHDGYDENREPSLINNSDKKYYYPICFYYIKNKEIKYNNSHNSKDLFLNNEIINPYKMLGITEEECKKIYQSSQKLMEI